MPGYLPPRARSDLAAILRDGIWRHPAAFGGSHSLPLARELRVEYDRQVVSTVNACFDQIVQGWPEPATYKSIEEWLKRLVDMRADLVFGMHLRQAFEGFLDIGVPRMATALDQALMSVVSRVESGEWYHSQALHFDQVEGDADLEVNALARLFNMREIPVDETGTFDRSAVLKTYARRHGELGEILARHMFSLGAQVVRSVGTNVDTLAAIVGSSEPMLANAAFQINLRMLARGPAELADEQLDEITRAIASDAAGGRRRRDLERLISSSNDAETRALATAERYTSLLEGPFRRFGWASHCLLLGETQPRPNLANVCKSLIADGGFFRYITSKGALIAVRNSVAHEEISWNGFTEELLLRGDPFELAEIENAHSAIDSWVAGSRAAFMHYRAARRPAPSSIGSKQVPDGDMDRVRDFFAHNEIDLVEGHFNARVATVTVRSLPESKINPLFQAILNVTRDVPGIEAFVVRTSDGVKMIQVSRTACEINLPVWEEALRHFSAMPLSTFLPLNYAARVQTESRLVAERSVAWIAVDDALDAAIEFAPTSNNLVLRLDSVLRAISHTQMLARMDNAGPLEITTQAISELRQFAATNGSAFRTRSAASADRALRRLFALHESWASTERLPGVPMEDAQYEADRVARVADGRSFWSA